MGQFNSFPFKVIIDTEELTAAMSLTVCWLFVDLWSHLSHSLPLLFADSLEAVFSTSSLFVFVLFVDLLCSYRELLSNIL
jgi:hypothetical protein